MKNKLHHNHFIVKPIIKSLIVVLAIIISYYSYVLVSNNQRGQTDSDLLNDMINKCSDQKNWTTCYGNEFAKVNGFRSLDETVDLLDELQKRDKKTFQCHLIAHKIAVSEVSKYPQKWKEILTKLPATTCNYGYIHGLVEGRMRYEKGYTLDEKSITEQCTMVFAEKKQIYGIDKSCAHIAGHILLVEAGGNVDKAVQICLKLPYELQFMCSGGVFMENFTRDNLVDHQITSYVAWDDKLTSDQENLCRKYAGTAGWGCWREMSHLYFARYGNDPDKVYDGCSVAPDQYFRDACYFRAVGDLILNEEADDSYMESLCHFYQDEYRLNKCMSEAVFSLLNSSSRYINKASQFCMNMPSTSQEDCISYINTMIHEREPKIEVRKKLCQVVSKKYEEVCYR